MKPDVILINNSDLGRQNTIGRRLVPIIAKFEQIYENRKIMVLCRDYVSTKKTSNTVYVHVVPFGKYVMRILTAVPIYLTKYFPANKFKNTIFTFFLKRKLKKICLDNVKIIHSWEFLPDLYRWLRETHPHIKILQDVAMAVSLDNVKAEDFSGEDIINPPSYMQESFQYIDVYIAPSAFVKDSLLRAGIKEVHVNVVPFGVDSKKFFPRESKAEKKFRVCFSGSISKRKGVPYLIQAWKELQLSDAELHMYGRAYPEVRPLFLGVENLYLHGFVSLENELNKNDLYVFPSLLEGSAKSVYEALACGLPVVTTHNAGSVVEHGYDGIIIPIQDKDAIKKWIQFFYDDRELLRVFSVRARKKAENFSWDTYAQKIISLYEI